MTTAQGLQALNAYPLPQHVVEQVCIARGLDTQAELSRDALKSSAYILAEADIFRWLATAPNVSQGGQSYNFTDAQRADFKRNAIARYKAQGEQAEVQSVSTAYGYKGSKL